MKILLGLLFSAYVASPLCAGVEECAQKIYREAVARNHQPMRTISLNGHYQTPLKWLANWSETSPSSSVAQAVIINPFGMRAFACYVLDRINCFHENAYRFIQVLKAHDSSLQEIEALTALQTLFDLVKDEIPLKQEFRKLSEFYHRFFSGNEMLASKFEFDPYFLPVLASAVNPNKLVPLEIGMLWQIFSQSYSEGADPDLVHIQKEIVAQVSNKRLDSLLESILENTSKKPQASSLIDVETFFRAFLSSQITTDPQYELRQLYRLHLGVVWLKKGEGYQSLGDYIHHGGTPAAAEFVFAIATHSRGFLETGTLHAALGIQGLRDEGYEISPELEEQIHIAIIDVADLPRVGHLMVRLDFLRYPPFEQIVLENFNSNEFPMTTMLGEKARFFNIRPQQLEAAKAVLQYSFTEKNASILEIGYQIPSVLKLFSHLLPSAKFAGLDLAPTPIGSQPLESKYRIKLLSGDAPRDKEVTSQIAEIGPYDIIYGVDVFHKKYNLDEGFKTGVSNSEYLNWIYRSLKESGVFIVVNDNNAEPCFSYDEILSSGLEVVKAATLKPLPEKHRELFSYLNNPTAGSMAVFVFRKGIEPPLKAGQKTN